MNGTSQDVGFTSYPSGATVTVDGDSLGVTPLTVSLPRKNNYLARIEADGYNPYETPIYKKTSGWVWGNLMFNYGGIVGLAVDFQSGGLNELTPNRIQVRLADGSILHKFDKSMWNIPPLNKRRIARELVAGGVGGAIGFYGSYYIFNAGINSSDPMARAIYGGTAGLIGHIVGNSLGVYFIGNLGNETGSLDNTRSGNVLGLTGATVLVGMLNSIKINASDNFKTFIFFAGSSIGATVALNRTRRYKTPPAGTEIGLINFRDGQMSLAAPHLYLRPSPFIRGELVQTVDLVGVMF